MDNQSSQTSPSTEMQTPSQKRDILDTPAITSSTPQQINQELLNTDANSPKYNELLNKLNSAISKPVREPIPSQQKSPETTSSQPETQEPQPSFLQKLHTLVKGIDPKYPGDLDILKTNLDQQKLNPNILEPLLSPILEEVNKTIIEIKQAEAEKSTTNTNKVTRFAGSIILRLTSTGIQTPLVNSSCKTITNIYRISRSTDTEPVTLQNPELDPTSKSNETTQDELRGLTNQINTLRKDREVLNQQVNETTRTNQDLTKQITYSQQKAQKQQTEFEAGIQELPSNKHRLAA